MPTSDGVQRIPGYCALCTSSCGCISVVENGSLVAVKVDPAHPSGKALCGNGRAAPELVHHEERLLHPLRRVSPKGDPEPRWERITWDEALDETAEALGRLAAERGTTRPAGALRSDDRQLPRRQIDAEAHWAVRSLGRGWRAHRRPAFDLYAERCRAFTPERVEAITWVPAE